jgi:hypothetical protein
MQAYQGEGMCNFIVILSIALALPFQAQTSGASIAQSSSVNAEDVLTRFVRAIGGVVAYDNIKSSVSEGNIVDWEGRRVPVERYWKVPDKSLMIEHRDRKIIRRGCAGNIRWLQEGNGKPKRLKLPYDLENDVDFGDILHWRDTFRKVNFAGEADVLNRRTYVLKVIGSRPATLYFDQQTGHLLRRDTQWEQSSIEIYYSHYVETSGVKMPWLVEWVYLKTGQKYISSITK